MMMVHGRDRLQAIAAGWPCARAGAGRVRHRDHRPGRGAEIVETSCVNGRGEVLLDTLVRPAGPIPAASSLNTRGSAHSPGH